MSDPTQLPLFDPIEIPLTKGYVAFVDPVDADLSALRWKALVGDGVYACRNVRNAITGLPEVMFMHRVILERTIARSLVPGELCDHIDCNPLNNIRSNLRVATYSENVCNRRKQKNNKSGYKGVCWDSRENRWKAQIQVRYKRRFLGYFDTPEAASEAYKAAAIKSHGEFARYDEVSD